MTYSAIVPITTTPNDKIQNLEVPLYNSDYGSISHNSSMIYYSEDSHNDEEKNNKKKFKKNKLTRFKSVWDEDMINRLKLLKIPFTEED